MTLLTTLESKFRFQDVHFLEMEGFANEIMAVACEDGKVRLYSIPPDFKVESSTLTHVADLIGPKMR